MCRRVLGGNTSNRQSSDGADHGLKPSFWSRFPVNPLRIIGLFVVVIVYILFPIYVYTHKLKVCYM
jgi:hypothetical protein